MNSNLPNPSPPSRAVALGATAIPPVDAVVTDHEPCCEYGPSGHTRQQHHDASPCYDQTCLLDHPHGGPFPHPCDLAAGGAS